VGRFGISTVPTETSRWRGEELASVPEDRHFAKLVEPSAGGDRVFDHHGSARLVQPFATTRRAGKQESLRLRPSNLSRPIGIDRFAEGFTSKFVQAGRADRGTAM
jgi:hypothetical protein